MENTDRRHSAVVCYRVTHSSDTPPSVALNLHTCCEREQTNCYPVETAHGGGQTEREEGDWTCCAGARSTGGSGMHFVRVCMCSSSTGVSPVIFAKFCFWPHPLPLPPRILTVQVLRGAVGVFESNGGTIRYCKRQDRVRFCGPTGRLCLHPIAPIFTVFRSLADAEGCPRTD